MPPVAAVSARQGGGAIPAARVRGSASAKAAAIPIGRSTRMRTSRTVPTCSGQSAKGPSIAIAARDQRRNAAIGTAGRRQSPARPRARAGPLAAVMERLARDLAGTPGAAIPMGRGTDEAAVLRAALDAMRGEALRPCAAPWFEMLGAAGRTDGLPPGAPAAGLGPFSGWPGA